MIHICLSFLWNYMNSLRFYIKHLCWFYAGSCKTSLLASLYLISAKYIFMGNMDKHVRTINIIYLQITEENKILTISKKNK